MTSASREFADVSDWSRSIRGNRRQWRSERLRGIYCMRSVSPTRFRKTSERQASVRQGSDRPAVNDGTYRNPLARQAVGRSMFRRARSRFLGPTRSDSRTQRGAVKTIAHPGWTESKNPHSRARRQSQPGLTVRLLVVGASSHPCKWARRNTVRSPFAISRLSVGSSMRRRTFDTNVCKRGICLSRRRDSRHRLIERNRKVVILGTDLTDGQRSTHAKILSIRSPCTSVNRKSRPWKR